VGITDGGWGTQKEKPVGGPADRIPARPNDLTADNRSFGRTDIRIQISVDRTLCMRHGA